MATHIITLSNGRDTIQIRAENSARPVGEWFAVSGALPREWIEDFNQALALPAFDTFTPVYVRCEVEESE